MIGQLEEEGEKRLPPVIDKERMTCFTHPRRTRIRSALDEVAYSTAPADEEISRSPLRLALVSTPRSGNTWLRYLLSEVYAIPSLAVHLPDEVAWETLPGGCLLQIHWHRTDAFLARLAAHRFQVVTIARHPLDVLISHLHHALHTLEDRALAGEGGDERSLVGAMPRSTAFLRYATGPRAAALLSVTSEWWHAPKVRQIRYESLVADASKELRALVDDLAVEVRRPIAEVVAELTMKELRARTGNERHFWMGQPGLWRSLLTAAEAAPIAAAHAGVFERLGYQCDPDPDLQAAQADTHWIELIRVERADDIRQLAEFRHALSDLPEQNQQMKAQLDANGRELELVRGELELVRGELELVRRDVNKAIEQWQARPRGMLDLIYRLGKAFCSRVLKLRAAQEIGS